MPSRIAIGFAGVVVVAGAWWLVHARSASSDAQQQGLGSGSQIVTSTPTPLPVLGDTADGLADGSAVSTDIGSATGVDPTGGEHEAAAQAVRVVASTGEFGREGWFTRRDSLRQIATPRFGTLLADRTSEQIIDAMNTARDAGRDTQLVRVESPMSVRSTATATGFDVEVWSVAVMHLSDDGPARMQWRTSTLSMQWFDQRGWLVDDWSFVEGPTPASALEGSFDSGSATAVAMGWTNAVTASAGPAIAR
jgi:hypothetical protein